MALIFCDAQLRAVDLVSESRDEARRVMDVAVASLVALHDALPPGGPRAAPAADVAHYGRVLELTAFFLRDMVRSAPRGAIIVRLPKAIWDDIIVIGGERLVAGFDHVAVADALIEMRDAAALCVGVDGESYTSPDAWCQQSWFASSRPTAFIADPTFYYYVIKAAAYLAWVITEEIGARIGAFLGALAGLGIEIITKVKFKTSDLWSAYKDYLVIVTVVLGIGATLYFLPQIKAALSPLTYKP